MNDMSNTASAAGTIQSAGKPAYVIYDTETTGLFIFKDADGKPVPADGEGQPRMASFGAVVVDADLNEVSRHNHFIKPNGWTIDGTYAAKVNGLTDEYLKEHGIDVARVLSIWNDWLAAGLTMVAFNAQFDSKVLRAELRRAGMPDRFEQTNSFCAMKALLPYKPRGLSIKGAGMVKLEEACRFFGIVNEKAHDAIADADAALAVFKHILADGHGPAGAARPYSVPPTPAPANEPENPRAVIGGNNPPEETPPTPPADEEDPIDAALSLYGDAIEEAQNWLDGTKVKNEQQMKAVDLLIKQVKAAKKAVEEAEEATAKPLYHAWQKAKARFKPTLTDLDIRIKGLVKCVDDFKRALADQKAEAERKARFEADKARREAEEATRAAQAHDYEAQRAAQDAQRAAEEAQAKAAAAKRQREQVKGLRTVRRGVMKDPKSVLRWASENKRDQLIGFLEEIVRQNFDKHDIPGVEIIEEKVAY